MDERGGRICLVTLGGGQRANALGQADWVRLRALFRAARRRGDLRAILVRGAGSTFTAGSDMHEWLRASERAVRRSLALIEATCEAIEEVPVPVIAQVRGVAAGAGCQLALACDFQVVSATARMGMPILRFGLLPPRSFTLRLMEHAGAAKARELLVTGRMLTGLEAADAGLATHCAADVEIEVLTRSLLEAVSLQPPPAVEAAKSAVREGLRASRRAARPRRRERSVLRDRFRSSLEAFLLQPRTTSGVDQLAGRRVGDVEG